MANLEMANFWTHIKWKIRNVKKIWATENGTIRNGNCLDTQKMGKLEMTLKEGKIGKLYARRCW